MLFFFSFFSFFFFFCFFFFFNDTATTEIYTLSLHDALPISRRGPGGLRRGEAVAQLGEQAVDHRPQVAVRSEEHTSELQSHSDLVCRLLLEKKKKTMYSDPHKKKKRTNMLH